MFLQCRKSWFDSWVGKICWRRDRLPTPVLLGFPCGSAGKESTHNVGDLGSIPGLGRSPEEGKGYPLRYSGLENSMDCIVHGLTKSQTWLRDFQSLPSPSYRNGGGLKGKASTLPRRVQLIRRWEGVTTKHSATRKQVTSSWERDWWVKTAWLCSSLRFTHSVVLFFPSLNIGVLIKLHVNIGGEVTSFEKHDNEYSGFYQDKLFIFLRF